MANGTTLFFLTCSTYFCTSPISFIFKERNGNYANPWHHSVDTQVPTPDFYINTCRSIANSVKKGAYGYTAIDFIDSSIQVNGEYVEFSGVTIKITPVGKSTYTHTIIGNDNANRIIYISADKHTKKTRAFLAIIDDTGEIIYAEELQLFKMLSAAKNTQGIDRCNVTLFDRDYCFLCIAVDL